MLGAWFARYKRYTNTFDRLVILLLVYASFCDSVEAGVFTQYGGGLLAVTLGGAALLLAVVLWLTTRAARLAHFNTEDEIAAVFCGSKKTAASGVPWPGPLWIPPGAGAHRPAADVLPSAPAHRVLRAGRALCSAHRVKRGGTSNVWSDMRTLTVLFTLAAATFGATALACSP